MTTAARTDRNDVDEGVESLARRLVDCARVVPGIVVDPDGGRARAQWWPLPAATDRGALAALCDGGSREDQQRVADALATAVDEEVRARLAARSCALLKRRAGRARVEVAWIAALTGDPYLPASLDGEKVAALATAVRAWVASGRIAHRRIRLCIRVCEPDPERGRADWALELLAQDTTEPSLVVPTADVWRGQSPFGPDAIEDLLAGLGHLARVAPELAAVLDELQPTEVSLDSNALLDLVARRADSLGDAGIGLLLPSWWTRRARLGLRAAAKTRGSGADVLGESGLGMDQIVSFRLVAALGGETLTQAELKMLERAAATKQGLVRVRGEWVEVRPDDLDAIRHNAGGVHEATIRELLRAGLGLEPTRLGDIELADDGVAITGVHATGWLGQLLDGASHAAITPISAPDLFHGELRPYQQRGVGWLRFLGRLGLGACLADDMGLGKTAQAIAALLADPVSGPTLVVCPVSVLGNWERELARFAPDLRVMAHHGPGRFRSHRAKFATRAKKHDVVLTTYSLVARDAEPLASVAWSRLVLDEAQQIKNPGTAQARAVQRIDAARRIAMTGTPVENRLSELWSVMQVLNPGLLGSRRAFRDRFAIPIEVDHDDAAAERLRRITAPFVLRRLKTDRSIITDLPDKIETTEHCPLTREQATLYQAVVDELLVAAGDADGMSRRGLVLAGLMKLKQVCNHPAHFLRDGSPLPGRSGKLTRTEEILDELLTAGDKVLCFTQFAEWGEMLAPHWSKRFGVPVDWLHGGVRRAKRDAMVEQFQTRDEPGVFLISLKAGGTGLNLTAASHVVHLDRWWNPAVEDQATDRAYRIGQRQTVQVHKLVSTGTVEERIDAMIAAKRALAERVVGTGENWITELSTDDLRATIALSADAIDESNGSD